MDARSLNPKMSEGSSTPTATLTYPALGTLQYGSGYWEGTIDLEALGGSFQLIVRATRDGPSGEQISAMSRVVSDAASIRKAAAKEMVDVHEESELLPDDLGPDAGDIWRHLHPSQVEVARHHRSARCAIFVQKWAPLPGRILLFLNCFQKLILGIANVDAIHADGDPEPRQGQ